jgi:hypothetical protein
MLVWLIFHRDVLLRADAVLLAPHASIAALAEAERDDDNIDSDSEPWYPSQRPFACAGVIVRIKSMFGGAFILAVEVR